MLLGTLNRASHFIAYAYNVVVVLQIFLKLDSDELLVLLTKMIDL